MRLHRLAASCCCSRLPVHPTTDLEGHLIGNCGSRGGRAAAAAAATAAAKPRRNKSAGLTSRSRASSMLRGAAPPPPADPYLESRLTAAAAAAGPASSTSRSPLPAAAAAAAAPGAAEDARPGAGVVGLKSREGLGARQWQQRLLRSRRLPGPPLSAASQSVGGRLLGEKSSGRLEVDEAPGEPPGGPPQAPLKGAADGELREDKGRDPQIPYMGAAAEVAVTGASQLDLATASTAAPPAGSTAATALTAGDDPRSLCAPTPFVEDEQHQRLQQQGGCSSNSSSLRRGFTGGSYSARRLAWRYRQYVRRRLRRLQQQRQKKQQQQQQQHQAKSSACSAAAAGLKHAAAISGSVLTGRSLRDRLVSPLPKLSPQCSYLDEDELRSESECMYTPFRYSRGDSRAWGDVSSPGPSWRRQASSSSSCSKDTAWHAGKPAASAAASGSDEAAVGEGSSLGVDLETPRGSDDPTWGGCGGGALGLEICMLNAIEQGLLIQQLSGKGRAVGGSIVAGCLLLPCASQSILLFNQRPEDGISHMQRLRLLENSPEAVAAFLLVTDGPLWMSLADAAVRFCVYGAYQWLLDRHLVAQVLGGSEARSVLLLKAFVSLLDLSHKDVEEALRHFCSFVPLSGEAQVVYRMLEMLSIACVFNPRFAAVAVGAAAAAVAPGVVLGYKEANPESPLEAESVHVLLYALLIANTSLHNPTVKRSRQAAMSRALFCQMVEAAGVNLETETLGRLYSRIAVEELRTFHSASEQSCVCCRCIEQIYIRLSREEQATAGGERLNPVGFGGLGGTSTLRCLDSSCCSSLPRCCGCCMRCSSSPAWADSGLDNAAARRREAVQIGMPRPSAGGDTLKETPGWAHEAGGDDPHGLELRRVDSRDPVSLTAATTLSPASAAAAETGAGDSLQGCGVIFGRGAVSPCCGEATLSVRALSPAAAAETTATAAEAAAQAVAAAAEGVQDWGKAGAVVCGWVEEVAPDGSVSPKFLSAGPTHIRLSSRPPRSARKHYQKQQQQQQQQVRSFAVSDTHVLANRDRGDACIITKPSSLETSGDWLWCGCCDVSSRSGTTGALLLTRARSASPPRCFKHGLAACRSGCCSHSGESRSLCVARTPRAAVSAPASPLRMSPSPSSYGSSGDGSCMQGSDRGRGAAACRAAAVAAARRLQDERRCSREGGGDWLGLTNVAAGTLGLCVYPKMRPASKLSLMLLVDIRQLHKQYIRQRARWGTVQVVQQQQQGQQQQQQQEQQLLQQGWQEEQGDSALLSCRARADRGVPAVSSLSLSVRQGPLAAEDRRAASAPLASKASSSNGSSSRDSSNSSSSGMRAYLPSGTSWLWRSLRSLGRSRGRGRVFGAAELQSARMRPDPEGGYRLVLDFGLTRVVLHLQQQQDLQEQQQHLEQQQQQQRQQQLPLHDFSVYLQQTLQRNAEKQRLMQEAQAARNVQQAVFEEGQLEIHWAVSGLTSVLQRCPQLLTPSEEGSARATLQANCRRRAELRQQQQQQQEQPEQLRTWSHGTTAAAAAAAPAAAGVGGSETLWPPDRSSGLQPTCFSFRGAQRQRSQPPPPVSPLMSPSVSPSVSPLPLRQRLAAGLSRVTARWSRRLWGIGSRCGLVDPLAPLFFRGLPPCLRPLLWPQCLLLASQSSSSSCCSKGDTASAAADTAGGDKGHEAPSSGDSRSKHARHGLLLPALCDLSADSYCIISNEDFLLLQAEARCVPEHSSALLLRHPGAASHAPAPGAAVAAAALGGDAAVSPSPAAGIGDAPNEARFLETADAAATPATGVCSTRECTNCSDASGGFRSSSAAVRGDRSLPLSCLQDEASVSCIADRPDTPKGSSSTTPRSNNSSSSSSSSSKNTGLTARTAAEAPCAASAPPSARQVSRDSEGDREGGRDSEGKGGDKGGDAEGEEQQENQQRQQKPLADSFTAAAAAAAAARASSSLRSRMQSLVASANTPTQADEGCAAAAGADGSAKACTSPQRDRKGLGESDAAAAAAAAAAATTPREKARLRRLRHFLAGVYPQLQQLPQRYGALVLPECSAQQLMALEASVAGESTIPAHCAGVSGASSYHCCCHSRAACVSSSSNSPMLKQQHERRPVLPPLHRCSCCQETVAAACGKYPEARWPSAEGDSSSSSNRSSSSSSSSDDTIAAGLRAVMEALFLLLPDRPPSCVSSELAEAACTSLLALSLLAAAVQCDSFDSLAKVAVVMLYYLDAYTVSNLLRPSSSSSSSSKAYSHEQRISSNSISSNSISSISSNSSSSNSSSSNSSSVVCLVESCLFSDSKLPAALDVAASLFWVAAASSFGGPVAEGRGQLFLAVLRGSVSPAVCILQRYFPEPHPRAAAIGGLPLPLCPTSPCRGQGMGFGTAPLLLPLTVDET
ncbi:hypothetical protein ACSSS7_006784 [Eimeria intestinalis]